MNEKFYILIKISWKFVPSGPIDNDPVLVHWLDNIMAPNRHQAIIWTNVDPIIYVALGEWINN